MYYMVERLAAAGNRIHLHYFIYRKGRNAGPLAALCTSVHAYKRKTFRSSLFSSLPHIVHSRISKPLIDRLNADEHRIILSSFHCAGMIPFLKRPERVVVRCHNDEAAYYLGLSLAEKQWMRKWYYARESALLKKFQATLPKDVRLACLSTADIAVLTEAYGYDNTAFIPAFLPWQQINSSEGMGRYCLYHGNLAVAENEAAAIWLIDEVFRSIDMPLVIAGSNATKRLQRAIARYEHIKLVENPSNERLSELIRAAHIHVLPSENRTGVKFKLLHALCEGRFVLSNAAGVNGSGVEDLVVIAEEGSAWNERIRSLANTAFTEADIKKREALLCLYNNKTNAQRL